MSDEIPEFICNHWDRVYSRGWIAYVDCDAARRRVLNGPVMINGKRYICMGVERNLSGPISKGESIGLLIEGQI